MTHDKITPSTVGAQRSVAFPFAVHYTQMPSRRFHRKSRRGCESGKQRRTRCGIERPSCQNCLRWNVACSFLETSQPVPAMTKQSTSTIPSPPGADRRSQFISAGFDDHNAQLMSHYSTVACLTTTDDPARLTAWRSTLPAMVILWSYLRHGLLALSAIYSSYLELGLHQKTVYLASARSHFGKALNAYIPRVKTATKESCPSLFAFATIVPLLAWSFLQTNDTDLHGKAFLDQFTGVWNFLLGAAAVAHRSRRWIHQSSMSSLVTMRQLSNVPSELAHDP